MPSMFRHSPHPHSPLIRHDLCARLAPLDRYALADFASLIVDGVLALANRSKTRVSQSARRLGA
jgi:hypothetical protein